MGSGWSALGRLVHTVDTDRADQLNSCLRHRLDRGAARILPGSGGPMKKIAKFQGLYFSYFSS